MPNTLTDAPIASNTLAFDQPRMEANNLYYLNTLSKDHQLALNTTDAVTFAGRHIQVSLNNRSNANLAMPGDGTDSLFWSSTGNLFWKNNTITSGVQLTSSNIGTVIVNTNGRTFLPGGLIIQWAKISTPASTGTVTFAGSANNIAFPTNLFSVFFNFSRNASGADSFWIDSTKTFDKTQFSWKASTSSAVALYWIAIGN